MIKILTIIGARPQIIKAAALSREIQKNFANQIEEHLLHTGQHYDNNMSDIFFNEMQIPKPNYNLNVGSASHGKQTAVMIDGIEDVLKENNYNLIVLYGDTNSTLAGAIAASKIHVPIVHIEAGLRSFNKSMPEEINRILCDHASTLLFSPTTTGINNLLKEGFCAEIPAKADADHPAIFHSGDVMYDNTLFYSEIAKRQSNILNNLSLNKKTFVLATIHRDSNTDKAENLNSIFKAINDISIKHAMQFVIPLHPRTSKLMPEKLDKKLYAAILENKNIIISEPLSFFDMMVLEENATLIMTDSGGVQKESYFFKKPCIILRKESEWIEIVKNGTAMLCGADYDKIINAFNAFISNPTFEYPPLFGNGNAANYICNKIVENFTS